MRAWKVLAPALLPTKRDTESPVQRFFRMRRGSWRRHAAGPLLRVPPPGQIPIQSQQQPPSLAPALAISQIDPQPFCPFFNGYLPTEIRDLIFHYALTPHQASIPWDSLGPPPYAGPVTRSSNPPSEDHRVAALRRAYNYPVDTHYTRPGYTHRTKLSLALLRTCKLAYLNLHTLPATMKEHVFWHGRGPEATTVNNEGAYLARLNAETLASVKEIHMFVQQFWLEGSFSHLCRLEKMQGIERLVITIRRGDWWNWEGNAPLGLNPHEGNASVDGMRAVWRKMERGQEPNWTGGGWGVNLKHLRNLKELELQLETSIDKKGELEEIVRWARGWKFPMGERGFLAIEGGLGRRNELEGEDTKKAWENEVQMTTWQGPPCLFSSTCPACNASGGDCETCRERANYRNRELGPMVVMMTLRYKLCGGDGDISMAD